MPVEAAITDAHTSEPAVLKARLQDGRLYVVDRGYAAYALFQAIRDAGSSFVGRLHDNAVLETIEDRPVSAEARAAGVRRDTVGRLGSKATRADLTRPVRVVEVACTPHRKRSGKTARGGPEQGQRLRLGLSGDTLSGATILFSLLPPRPAGGARDKPPVQSARHPPQERKTVLRPRNSSGIPPFRTWSDPSRISIRRQARS